MWLKKLRLSESAQLRLSRALLTATALLTLLAHRAVDERVAPPGARARRSSRPAAAAAPPAALPPVAPVPVIRTRADIGRLLQAEAEAEAPLVAREEAGGAPLDEVWGGAFTRRRGFRHGAELGVQRGIFAEQLLQTWPACESLLLVDVWAPLDNYVDVANVPQREQDAIMREALERTAFWRHKLSVCRNLTTLCAAGVRDGALDFVYVDARHDRQGVAEDLRLWWPKVRPGGLVCGHDFVRQDEGPAQSGQRWDINGDGSTDPTGGAVRGAVEDFARVMARQIQVAYADGEFWSWCVRR